MARVEALVKGALLVWARDSAGLSIEDAAKKVQVKAEALTSWENDQARPSIPQLRKLANLYKRPLAVFYLPAPPKGFAVMRDFRRLPGQVAGKQSPELRRAIRQAVFRQQTAVDLYETVEGEVPPTFELTLTLDADPEVAGERLRAFLDVSLEDQFSWRGYREAFNAWREAVEAHGAVVQQVTDVDTDEMRAFSLGEAPLPTVVLNISDPVRARIFSMLHETAHLALREGGLCDLDEEQERPPEEMRAEVFCNHVAGAALVPRGSLLAEPVVARQRHATSWTDAEIESLATRYHTSREVLVRRLVLTGRTTTDFYQAKRAQYRREYAELLQRTDERPGGFAPPDVMAVSTAGPLLSRLVVEGYNLEAITASDVADYLDVRLQHLPKIERAVLRSTR